MGRFADKLALVSGASRGLGRALAKALAREGAHVILAARREGSLEDVDDEIRSAGGTATLVKLDLSDGDKIDALGPSIYERWGKLDVLVANAGMLGPLSPLPHISVDAWENVMAVNLTANWRLIRTLDPLLRHAEAGRAVFLSSGAAAAKSAYWGPYSVSKAGLEALVKTYALEIANTNVRANLVNPGPMRTDMRQQAFPGEDPETLPVPEEIAERCLDVLTVSCMDNGHVFNFDYRLGTPAGGNDTVKRIVRVFLAGLFALLPLVVTIAAGIWVAKFAIEYIGPNSSFGNVLTSIGLRFDSDALAPYLIGLLVVIGIVWLFGLLVETSIGPWFNALVDGMLARIPVIGSIYQMSRRFIAVVDTNDEGGLKNMTPVWCYFGGEGSAAVLALLPSKAPVTLGARDYYAVLVPSAPVPVGGALVYVPDDWVKPAEIGIDELISIYVSMGLTPPKPITVHAEMPPPALRDR